MMRRILYLLRSRIQTYAAGHGWNLHRLSILSSVFLLMLFSGVLTVEGAVLPWEQLTEKLSLPISAARNPMTHHLNIPGIGGSSPEIPTDPDEPICLSGFYENTASVHYPYLDQLVILEEEEPLDLSFESNACYITSNGAQYVLPIVWDTSPAVLEEPGLHTVTAKPILQENMTLADDFDGIRKLLIFRKGPDAVLNVTPLENPSIPDALIAQRSTDPASEISITTKSKYCAVGEKTFYLTTADWIWEWDFSDVDTSAVGSYTITGTLIDHPDWITVPETSRTATLTAYVMPTDRIELYAPTRMQQKNAVLFEWLYDGSSVTEAHLQWKNADGHWEDCDPDWYYYKSASFYSNSNLNLYLLEMPSGRQYTLRLHYLEEASGEIQEFFTDEISITIPENIEELLAKSGGKIPDELDIGGNRDGGDHEGDDLPDFSQPAPGDTEENESDLPTEAPTSPEVPTSSAEESAPNFDSTHESPSDPSLSPSSADKPASEDKPGNTNPEESSPIETLPEESEASPKEDKTDDILPEETLPEETQPRETPSDSSEKDTQSSQTQTSALKETFTEKSSPGGSESSSEESLTSSVMESVTETTTTISGLRLRELTASGSTVLFEKQGISLEIPSSLLEALDLGDHDLLAVTIHHPQKNAVRIAVTADGAPVNDLTGSVLYIPWESAGVSEPSVYNEEGTPVSDITVLADSDIISLNINAPGIYFLNASPDTVSSQAPAREYPFLILISGALLLFLLLMVLIYRRKRMHE